MKWMDIVIFEFRKHIFSFLYNSIFMYVYLFSFY